MQLLSVCLHSVQPRQAKRGWMPTFLGSGVKLVAPILFFFLRQKKSYYMSIVSELVFRLMAVLALCDKYVGFDLQFGYWVSKRFAVTAAE